MPRMHADELDVDAALVRRLLAAQFPHWANDPIRPVASTGTDNALFRLGDDRVARLPRIHWAAGQPLTEARWLPRLAPQLPLPIPVPLALGEPALGYPFPWSVVRWLPGATVKAGELAHPARAAEDLGRFVAVLRRVEATGGPPPASPTTRGAPLVGRDDEVQQAISALGPQVNGAAVRAAWAADRDAPPWDGPPVWLHGDLLPGNLLFRDGHLSGVIDWGGTLAVGDPAADLIPAWALFSGESRRAFRATVGADDATWARGRGWALSIALIALPYYLHTFPAFVSLARRMVREVLADHAVS